MNYNLLNKTFYERNASQFSRTRVYPWEVTRQFIDNFSPFSRILDIGCGNGRNMFYRDDIIVHGVDASHNLCEIVREKGGQAIVSCMTNLPIREKYDGVMMVASLHHLYDREERIQAIREGWRVLKNDGKMYIHVWAMEQPQSSRRKFTKQDEIVGWYNTEGEYFERYYRIYRKGELECEIQRAIGYVSVHTEYSYGNWVCTIYKDCKSI
jgi:SAM-dependent methyltransferase